MQNPSKDSSLKATIDLHSEHRAMVPARSQKDLEAVENISSSLNTPRMQ